MKIVIINSGSSSIKYQMIDMPSNEVICSGMIDRIGLETSNFSYVTNAVKVEETLPIANHKIGLQKISQLLMDEKVGVIKSTSEIDAVGHRVVHGGESFSASVVIDDKVIKAIEDCIDLLVISLNINDFINIDQVVVVQKIKFTGFFNFL